MSNQIVLFVKGYNGFNEGEIVGFEPEYADRLISIKVAKKYVAPGDGPPAVVRPAAASLENFPQADRALKQPPRKRGGK